MTDAPPASVPFGPRRRRLRAVMAADVANFGGMVSVDETSTLEAVWTMRRIAREELALHGGWLFGLPGDGIFALFESAVDAVRCAQETQRRLEGAPHLRALKLRVGIHLGEVLFQEEQPFGEALVIAARLESQAKPGGILISSPVMEAVAPRIRATFSERGVVALKHSPRRIEAFDIHADPTGAADATAAFDALDHTMLAAQRSVVRPVVDQPARAEPPPDPQVVANADPVEPGPLENPPVAAEPVQTAAPAEERGPVEDHRDPPPVEAPPSAAPSRDDAVVEDPSVPATNPEPDEADAAPALDDAFGPGDFPADTFPIEAYYGEDVPLVPDPSPPAAPSAKSETVAEAKTADDPPPGAVPASEPAAAPDARPAADRSIWETMHLPPTTPLQVSPLSPTADRDPTTIVEPINLALAARAFPEECVIELTRILTLHVGPVARVLVDRAARRSFDLDALIDALAASIPTETERRHFAAVAGLATTRHRRRENL